MLEQMSEPGTALLLVASADVVDDSYCCHRHRMILRQNHSQSIWQSEILRYRNERFFKDELVAFSRHDSCGRLSPHDKRVAHDKNSRTQKRDTWFEHISNRPHPRLPTKR